MADEVKRIWKESAVTKSRHYHGICLAVVRTVKKHCQISRCPAEIRTEHRTSMSLERYRYANPLRRMYYSGYSKIVLWPTNPLLSDDCAQRPFLSNGSVNTFPLLGIRFLTMLQLHQNNGRAVFPRWSVPTCYKQGTKLVNNQFCTGVCEERTWAGGRRMTIVGAVTRKRLVTDRILDYVL
jgi:hypothetical protein